MNELATIQSADSAMELSKFDVARLRLYEQMERSKLSTAERLVLQWVRNRSWGRGKSRAYVDRLDVIAADQGLHRPDVSRAIRSLARKRVLQQGPPQWWGINVLFFAWNVTERQSRGVQEQLPVDLEFEPDLPEALRQTFVEFAGGNPARVGESGASPLARRETATVFEELRIPSGAIQPTAVPGFPTRQAGEALPPRPPLGIKTETTAEPRGIPGGMEMTGHPAIPCRSMSISVSDSLTEKPPEKVRDSLTAPGSPPYPPLQGNGTTGNGTTEVMGKTVKRSENTVLIARSHTDPARARARGVRKSLTADDEHRLLGLVLDWVGQADFAASNYFWRELVTRNFPEALEEALADCQDLERTKYPIRDKRAFLTAKIAKFANVRDWGRVAPGPEPRE